MEEHEEPLRPMRWKSFLHDCGQQQVLGGSGNFASVKVAGARRLTKRQRRRQVMLVWSDLLGVYLEDCNSGSAGTG